VNLVSQLTPGFFLYSFSKRTIPDKWLFFMGWMFFLSSNQQSQTTERNTNPTSGLALSLLYASPNSWWKGHCSLYTGSLTAVPDML